MHAPKTDHLTAMHRILRYLKGSPGQGILYKSHGHAKAMAFTDSDWAGSLTCRKSTRYCTMVGGNHVSWKSKKQVVTSPVQKQSTEL